jgi:hypothetical protein
MSQHESHSNAHTYGESGAHDDHAHDNTEGNRQYYPKGWWVPLGGLAAIALCFALLGGWILSMSGTDKWGQQHSGEHAVGEHHEQPAPTRTGTDNRVEPPSTHLEGEPGVMKDSVPTMKQDQPAGGDTTHSHEGKSGNDEHHHGH